MADYVRKAQLMLKKGMSVALPGDRLSPEYFQYSKNVRSYKPGEWRQRGGMTLLYPSIGSGIYFITRVNNNNTNTFRRFVGALNGNVYVDNGAHNLLSVADGGYGGTDYSSVISRPDRSPLPYLFLATSQRQSKFSSTGARSEWGISAPVTPPDPALQLRPMNLILYPFNFGGGFVGVGGTATSGFASAVNTSVTHVLYDVGSTGMACINPAVLTEALAQGMVVLLSLTGSIPLITIYVVVEDVFQPISDTTIDSIAYDSGATGLCTIQLATATTGLRKDSMIRLGGTENVRVLSVTDGLDGLPSFRCSTTGTFAVGNGVAGLRSFRAYIPGTITGGGVWGVQTATQDLSIGQSGIVTLSTTFGSPQNFASSFGRPLQPEDFICIGLWTSNTSQVTEIQVQFDCDAATNDFTKNYFFKSLRQPDLQAAVNQTAFPSAAQQTGISRSQVDQFIEDQFLVDRPALDTGLQLGDASRLKSDQLNLTLGSGFEIGQDQGPVSEEAVPGAGSWSMLYIPISDFQRVGNDSSRGWANIKAFRLSINNNGATAVGLEAVWVGGTYGPNTVNLPEYTYVYRGRNSATGSVSNPSPPTRSPINPKREAVYIQPAVLPDTQADYFDFYRIGGTLTNFHYVGSCLAGQQFQDTIPDSIARRNNLLEINHFKPWPRSDLTKSGVCNIVGTRMTWVSGDTFNTAWVRGTQVIIGNRAYTLYSNPSSTTTLDLNESGGTQTSVAFQIPDPLLDGQPMPAVFGPFAGAFGEFLFGCGDPINPGYLYYTNGNDPESASDANYIELCPPSEKLMNGIVLDGIVYCFSDRRSWRILPSFQGGQTAGGSEFYPQETSMGKGLAGRFGICVGDAIYFVSFDGVYRSRGDSIESLTNDTLAPLFNRDGTIVTDFVVPVTPIDFSSSDDISLTYSYDGIYLTYKAIDTNTFTFYYSFLTGGWTLDSIGTGRITRSSREVLSVLADNVLVGTSGGKLMLRSNSVFLDDADAISCELWDREELWDDIRSTKQVGDVMVDVDPAGATLTPTMRYEANTSNDVLATITGSGRDQFTRDINSGSGRIVRGAALDLTWSNGTAGQPKVYAWEPSALIKPEESVNRASDWDSGGYSGTKWLQGFRLRGDTLGIAKDFQVESDGGTFVESFTFTANGEQVVTFWLTNPVVGHTFRIKGTDSDLWRNMGIEWIFEPEPEQAAVWETQVTSFDLPFFHHMREVMIAHRSTADITMTVSTDGGVSNIYTIPNGGGSRIRSYLSTKGIKTKFTKFRFTSAAPFGLWIRDIECRVGAWGRTDSYSIQRPFGDISRSNGGARI